MDAGAPTYPVGTIAKLLLLTERRVQQLTKDGVIPRSERGRYELVPAVQGYVKYLQERSHGSSGAPADYHLEKARLVKLQADRAETELAELRGELVSASDVADAWAQMLSTIKMRILAIPSKSAKQLAIETDPAVVQELQHDMLCDVLMELSEYGSKRDDAIDGWNDGSEAAA